jgi:hypothetical protein
MRWSTALALLGLLVAACRSSERTPEARFWRWFATRAAGLRSLDSARAANEISVELRKLDPHLAAELGPPSADARPLHITAHGAPAAFPAVYRLVDAAPALPGWRIGAFRPRQPLAPVAAGGVTLRPDQVWFTSRTRGDRIDLVLYIEGLTARPGPLTAAADQLIDAGLGEYDVAARLGVVGHEPAPVDTRRLRPLSDLAATFDELDDEHYRK